MENKGKQKNNPRDDMSLDQAILQWIVDDYDIPDEKSRKIVGESGEKSKLITCKIRTDKFFGIVIKIAHLYGFQGSWNVIPRMLTKIIDGIPI